MPTTDTTPLTYGANRVICIGCSMPVPREELVDGRRCGPCWSDVGNRKRKQEAIIRRGHKRDAFREFAVAMRRSPDLQNEGTAAKILKRLAQKAGGTDGIADLMWEDMQAARGEGLPEDEQKRRRGSRTVMGYHKMFQTYIRDTDEAKGAVNLADLDPEDLKATLVSVALELLESDDAVQDALVPEFLARRPDVLERLGYVKLAGSLEAAR